MYKPHFDVTDDKDLKMAVFCTSPAIRNSMHNFISELVGTFVLLFGALAMTKPSDALGTLNALPVALLVLGIGLCLGGPTGYAINPARDLGPRLAHFILPIKTSVIVTGRIRGFQSSLQLPEQVLQYYFLIRYNMKLFFVFTFCISTLYLCAQDPEANLIALGITLPSAASPAANYVNAVRTGNLIYLAGKGPLMPDGKYITGKIGQNLTIEQGYEAARLTALMQIAVLKMSWVISSG